MPRYSTKRKYIYLSRRYEGLKYPEGEPSGRSDADIAEELGVSIAGLNSALRWRRSQPDLSKDADRLNQHIEELKARLDERLQTIEELKRDLKDARKALKIPAVDDRDYGSDWTHMEKTPARHTVVTALSKAIADHERVAMDIRTRIMELEGLYKETVNIELGVKENNPLYDAMCELTEQLRRDAQ